VLSPWDISRANLYFVSTLEWDHSPIDGRDDALKRTYHADPVVAVIAFGRSKARTARVELGQCASAATAEMALRIDGPTAVDTETWSPFGERERRRLSALHRVSELADPAPELAANFRELSRAEQDEGDRENDQEVPRLQ
jgi:hypothetical protein